MYLREIVGSSWLRARDGHPVPGRVLGENFAYQVDEVVDGCLRESALVLRRATVRPDGQAPAGSDWGGEHLCHRIEGAVDGGLGDVGEAEVVVAGIGPQPGEGLVQMEAGAF
jgi:hypothetical protein